MKAISLRKHIGDEINCPFYCTCTIWTLTTVFARKYTSSQAIPPYPPLGETQGTYPLTLTLAAGQVQGGEYIAREHDEATRQG